MDAVPTQARRPAAVDYLALGNPTVDVRPNGIRQIGGSAVYGTLQAARLGLVAGAVGRGRPDDIDALWKPFAAEADLRLLDAPATTMFRNENLDGQRVQWVQSSAGALADPGPLPRAKVVHLAPVVAEVDLVTVTERLGEAGADFVGLTPQGMVRHWRTDGLVGLRPLAIDPAGVRGVDAVVFADYEAPFLEELAALVRGSGGVVVVTRADRGCEVRSRTGIQPFPAYPVGRVVDETGAGDVFSASFFTALEAGLSMRKAVRLGSAAAAIKIQGIGPDAVGRLDDIAELTGAPES
ncbi:MAG: PfkB family carbohydrate kinase [Frankia sp.]